MIKAASALLLLAFAAWSYQAGSRTRGGTTQQEPAPVAHEQSESQAQNGQPVAGSGDIGRNPGLPNDNSPSTYSENGISFSARLLDPAENTRNNSADVAVDVSGIQLMDPDQARERAVQGQGHLQYRVDDGPVIVTTATKLEFLELPHGRHRITIDLAANDGTPIGPHQVLWVTIP